MSRPACFRRSRLDETVRRLHSCGDLGRRERRPELAHGLRHLCDCLADVARPRRGREEPQPLGAGGDREPRLRPHRGGRDGGRPVVRARHARCLDPLECRLALGELDELPLREVHVDEPLRPAPVLQRVEIEADHVRLRDQPRIDAPTLGERRRARVEVVGERQEAHAVARVDRGHGLRGQPSPVRLVGIEDADDGARIGDRLRRPRPPKARGRPARATALRDRRSGWPHRGSCPRAGSSRSRRCTHPRRRSGRTARRRRRACRPARPPRAESRVEVAGVVAETARPAVAEAGRSAAVPPPHLARAGQRRRQPPAPARHRERRTRGAAASRRGQRLLSAQAARGSPSAAQWLRRARPARSLRALPRQPLRAPCARPRALRAAVCRASSAPSSRRARRSAGVGSWRRARLQATHPRRQTAGASRPRSAPPERRPAGVPARNAAGGLCLWRPRAVRQGRR